MTKKNISYSFSRLFLFSLVHILTLASWLTFSVFGDGEKSKDELEMSIYHYYMIIFMFQ